MALNRSDKSRILRRYFPGMTRNSEMSTEPSNDLFQAGRCKAWSAVPSSTEPERLLGPESPHAARTRTIAMSFPSRSW